MKVIRHLNDLTDDLRHGVVAIGNFDGVHLGHKYIIEKTIALAKELSAPAIILTFEPHPKQFFNPDLPAFRLTPFRSKVHEIEKLGIDAVIALTFDESFAATSADTFIQDILLDKLKARHVITGDDFCFGKDRKGTPESLQTAANKFNFGLTQLTKIKNVDGLTLSSSAARKFLETGAPEKAALILGKPFVMEGRVIHGNKLGRTIGYPTANILTHDYLSPTYGVYAVRLTIDGEGTVWEGAANYGIRPTINGKTPILEVYIFDFNRDIYDAHVRVDLLHFIRPELKFESLEALKPQIDDDCQAAKSFLKSHPLTSTH